jgi:dihydrofolate reductase
MKTQYYTASSLDGFIATEDHSLDWLFQFGDTGSSGFDAFLSEVGALVMGSQTYEWILRNHVRPESQPSQPWPYEQPAWVLTSRPLPAVEDADIQFVSGDVRHLFRKIAKAADVKNIWIVGGGDVAGQFYDNGLLDEIIVQVSAVTLGSGRPLLPRRIIQPPLTLLSARTFGNAFVELKYRVNKTSTA